MWRPLRGSSLHEFSKVSGISRSDGDVKAGSGICQPPLAIIGIDEFPAGYFLASCDPAELASAFTGRAQNAIKCSCRSRLFAANGEKGSLYSAKSHVKPLNGLTR